MRKFYETYGDLSNLPPVAAKMPWTHNSILVERVFYPSFIGQLQFYATAVDETIKQENDNPTIGLLLCKNKEKYSVEWSLKSSLAPIGVASYEIKDYLPSEDDINKYLS